MNPARRLQGLAGVAVVTSWCFLGLGSCATEAVSPHGPPPVEPSPVSDTDSLAPAGPRTAATLVGTVADEAGRPVEHCVIELPGDPRELGITTGAAGVFEAGVEYGHQKLTIICDKQLYQPLEATLDVPHVEEFQQTFTVQSL